MSRFKIWAADMLMRAASNLDPNRPTVVTNSGGGWQVQRKASPC